MSRSKRTPATYVCCGADSVRGKIEASRRLRHRVNQEIHKDGECFDFVDVQDRVRGNAGSRSRDYGWNYFGDGRLVVFRNPFKPISDWMMKLSRK